MRRITFRLLLVLALGMGLFPAAAQAEEQGAHSDNLSYVKNLPYAPRNGGTPNFGTDIEFGKVGGREYAFAGSYRNGLQIVDITDPREATIAAVYDCGVTQGDVQVFRRADLPGRTFVTYTSDTFGDGTSTCYREAAALGFDVRKSETRGKNGTFIAEVTDPLNPKTVSFVEVPQGSHNQTVHPSGRFLYNSNSDLITSALPAIEIYDISDFAAPKLATELPLPTRPGLGTESHDITFNSAGTRAYSAALSQGVIIDTTNPGQPSIVTSFLDPAINVWHQSDPFSLTDPATGTKRDFLIVEDEVAGAIGTGQCPNGGVHIYDITGANERNPVKVGYWNIDEIRATDSVTDSCTAHVFDIHESQAIMTIAFYNGGVRVVDISGLTGISLGDTEVTGAGMQEIAFYRTTGADSWSAKTPKIQRNGDFFLYGNDINRGLDIYKFSADRKKSPNKGQWKSPKQAEADALATPRLALTEDTAPFCLLPQP
ncbi:MAG: hypothetical protein M3548_16825 [Actinomycetota bacterium]|nr:hypothetical protein [Actinomycetota bacterium]